MELKYHNTTKTITIGLGIIFSTVLLISTFFDDKHAFAIQFKVEIDNGLEENLVFNEVENRQDVQIKSSPPDVIESQQTGTFKIAQGDSGKSPHLKVQYYVGEKGSDETVTIILKSSSWIVPLSCHTETSSESITGKVKNCGDNDIYEFKFN